MFPKTFLTSLLFFNPMLCPFCGSERSKVVDKRETNELRDTRRRRECLDCEKRFTTYERIESTPLVVIKKDGSKENFDRDKLKRGIIRSCEKRDVSLKQIESIVSEVEQHLKNKSSSEINSSLIGRLVMTRLKKIDKVSYIRFASVYRDFKDPEEFQEEVDRLMKKNG